MRRHRDRRHRRVAGSQRPEDTPVISEDIIEHNCRLQQPRATKITAAGSEGIYGNRYNSNRCWQYADNYQVGERIDIYA